jgi:hypothetical protein
VAHGGVPALLRRTVREAEYRQAEARRGDAGDGARVRLTIGPLAIQHEAGFWMSRLAKKLGGGPFQFLQQTRVRCRGVKLFQ